MPDDALGRARTLQWLAFETERIGAGVGAARFMVITNRFPEMVPVFLLPGFVKDLEPYPENAHAGASRSIYNVR